MSDSPQNIHGTPGENEEADTASGGAPEDEAIKPGGVDPDLSTDDEPPVDNPSGG